jgi:opacity protein-like surface antigen
MSRFQLPGTLLVLALLMLATSSSFAIDLGGHDRDGTVVGLTFGYGWNTVEFTPEGGQPVKSSPDGFSGGFRVGWASSDHFIASIGMYGWKKSYYTYQYTSTSVTNYHFMLEGYYFPRGEGFWVKGGIGRGTLDLNATAPLPSDSIIFNEKDWTLGAGAGYEFRVSDGAALGISYDFFYLSIGDGGGVTDISTTSHNLSFNIHFYVM